MRRHRQFILTVLCASLAIGATGLGTTIAEADSDSRPDAVTRPATDVGTRAAVLRALVDPNDKQTSYWFEYGTTAAYGKYTPPASAGSGDSDVPVSHALAGLTPNTTYHVRVVAWNHKGVDLGADVIFTTAADSGGAAPSSPAPGEPATPGAAQPLAPEAAPELGKSVNMTATAGKVLVRVPGATSAVALEDVASIPVGAIVDTRNGTVELQTALPGGQTQSGSFRGGLFQIRQPVTGRGMTELVLRGPLPTCGTARAAATTRKRPPRKLWSSDNKGRFRTRGSNAVATVRGTSWFMADRCDGTYTRVSRGSVAVRELRTGRTIVLRAGQSHLARKTR
jgi:hypothetical protein